MSLFDKHTYSYCQERRLSNAVYGFFVVQVHAHIVPKGIVGKTDVHANNLKATYCISVRLFENRVIVFQSISNQNINICIMKEKTQEYHFSLGLTVICETKRNADFGNLKTIRNVLSVKC